MREAVIASCPKTTASERAQESQEKTGLEAEAAEPAKPSRKRDPELLCMERMERELAELADHDAQCRVVAWLTSKWLGRGLAGQ